MHVAPSPPSQAMSEAAERFKNGLARETAALPGGFAHWKRSRSAVRLLAWLATFGLLASGAIALALQAPASVSAGLELVGFGAGWWLKRQRRQHLTAIKAWAPAPDPASRSEITVSAAPN